MNKFLLIIIAVLTLFLLNSCGNATNNEILNKFQIEQNNQIISNNFNLTNTFIYNNQTYTLTWKTNNNNLCNIGELNTTTNKYLVTIKQDNEVDTTIKLTATLKYNEEEYEKEFVFFIPKLVKVISDIESAAKNLTIAQEEQIIVDNFYLTNTTTYNNQTYTITWKTNNNLCNIGELNTATNKYLVTMKQDNEVDTAIKLTATLKYNEEEYEKEFVFFIPKAEKELGIKVAADKLDIIQNGKSVIENFDLDSSITVDNIEYLLKWKSSDSVACNIGQLNTTTGKYHVTVFRDAQVDVEVGISFYLLMVKVYKHVLIHTRL